MKRPLLFLAVAVTYAATVVAGLEVVARQLNTTAGPEEDQ